MTYSCPCWLKTMSCIILQKSDDIWSKKFPKHCYVYRIIGREWAFHYTSKQSAPSQMTVISHGTTILLLCSQQKPWQKISLTTEEKQSAWSSLWSLEVPVHHFLLTCYGFDKRFCCRLYHERLLYFVDTMSKPFINKSTLLRTRSRSRSRSWTIYFSSTFDFIVALLLLSVKNLSVQAYLVF
jgi:hypothetical protein